MRLASPVIARAAADYRWLLDRGYAPSASLKLVGDRQGLTRDERMILFRGVASSEASASRHASIADGGVNGPGEAIGGRDILVDGYNQALTAMHYLAGRPLFIGTDGLTRDAGGSYGRISDKALFERSIALLVDRLASPRPASIVVYLDAPVPGSGNHAGLFREAFRARGAEAEVELEKSADAPLKAAAGRARARSGAGPLIATSDSVIADALSSAGAAAQLYDAARWAIELAFGKVEFLDLGRLLAGLGAEREAR